MKYTVDIQSLKAVMRNIQEKSDRALEICGEHLKTEIKKQMKTDSYDLWNLARSVESRLVRHWLVEVWSALVYATIREYGRKPWKFPPLDALVWWTARKKMISKGNTTKKYDDLHYKDKGVVFVIARSIAKKGIKGKHTFQNVLDRERANIKKLYIQNMK